MGDEPGRVRRWTNAGEKSERAAMHRQVPCGTELDPGSTMGTKIRYSVRYRTDAAPRGGYVTELVDAESETAAIQLIRKRIPKATEIVAKPK